MAVSSSVLDPMVSLSKARLRSELILVFQIVKFSSVRTGIASRVVLSMVGFMSSIVTEDRSGLERIAIG